MVARRGEAMAVEPIPDRASEERLPAEPKPLTDTELEQLQTRNDVVGLPSTEVRRLFAEVRRLRRLAEESRVMARFAAILGAPKTCPACGVSPLAWQVYTPSDGTRGRRASNMPIRRASAAGCRCDGHRSFGAPSLLRRCASALILDRSDLGRGRPTIGHRPRRRNTVALAKR